MYVYGVIYTCSYILKFSEYKAGITIEIANNLLKLRDEIQDWSVMNEYGVNNNHL